MTGTDPQDALRTKLLDAALLHVTFDGWSEETFRAASRDAGIDPALAKVLCPRGAVDLAIAYHERADAEMLHRLETEDLPALRLRDRIATAIRFRIEAIHDREAVRRGTALFSLPPYVADGARLIWGTADRIWTALGDNADDINWYTKRATLSAVYSSTVLYWLGDDSPEYARTWAFLDRRIEGVMQFEKFKAQVNKNPLLKPLFAGPNWALSWVKAPTRVPNTDLPGSWSEPRN